MLFCCISNFHNANFFLNNNFWIAYTLYNIHINLCIHRHWKINNNKLEHLRVFGKALYKDYIQMIDNCCLVVIFRSSRISWLCFVLDLSLLHQPFSIPTTICSLSSWRYYIIFTWLLSPFCPVTLYSWYKYIFIGWVLSIY